MVRGPSHTNLIFDMEIPFDLGGRRRELYDAVRQRVRQEGTHYYTIVNFDEVPRRI